MKPLALLLLLGGWANAVTVDISAVKTCEWVQTDKDVKEVICAPGFVARIVEVEGNLLIIAERK